MKKLLHNKLLSGGGFYISSLIIADGLNFIFNAFLGRVLTFEQFGLITLINTLWTLVNIGLSGLGTTVNHKTSFLSGEKGEEESISFYKVIFRKTLIIGSILSVLWVVATPFLSAFFDIDRVLPLLFFTPMILIGMLSATNRGFLQGRLYFDWFAVVIITEAFSKLLIACLFILLHANSFAYTAIILCEIAEFSVGMWYVYRKTRRSVVKHNHHFPTSFYTAALTAKLSTSSFLILDVVIAKHFLSPLIAGEYAFLALVGKMIFYFGSLLSAFIVSLISREEGRKKNPEHTFNKIILGTTFLTLFVYLFIGPLGSFTIPIMFGKKAYAILPYLSTYGLSIAFYTISTQIVTYRLSRKHYVYPIIALFFSFITMIGMTIFHKSIGDIVAVMLGVSFLNFIIIFVMNIMGVHGEFIKRNIIDFLEIIMPIGQPIEEKKYKKKILIFNWRDTKHSFAGGAEVYINEMAKRWEVKGYKVTVFCGNDGKNLRHEIIDGIEIIRRGGFYFVYVWAFFYYMLRLRGKYDIIIDSENGIPFFTPLYVKEPVFCLMHHIHQEVFRRTLIKPLAILAQFLEKDLMPLVYKNARFITVSESTKKDMEKIGLGKAGIQIIHPGVNLKEMQPGKKSTSPMVLYLGRLKAYKSIHVLLQASVEIIKQIPNVNIVIAGDGEDLKRLKKIVKGLNITNNITFVGKVTEKEKILLYQKAWVFVNPSMMEGWGITTIEANACGTPIVAADVPGLRDAVSHLHSGFLVDYGNTNKFAEKILQLLHDTVLRKQMSRAAVTWAKGFDWEKNAEKCLQIISEEEVTSKTLIQPSLSVLPAR